jgi:cytochrome b561
MLIIVSATGALLYLTFGGFVVLAQLSGTVVVIFASPRLLRAPSLKRIDRRAMERAQRLRRKRRIRQERLDKWLMRASHASEYAFLLGTICLLVSGVLFITAGPARTVAALGLALCLSSFAAAFLIIVSGSMYAQLKGDEATGPMVFHKAEGLASYIEQHEDVANDVQLWAAVLAIAFIVAAVVAAS